MKKACMGLAFLLAVTFTQVKKTQAAAIPIAELIRQAVIKAIKAADLVIQREQNKIIWLQNAQKTLENAMSKLRLKEIGEWSQKQREQYQQYFDELWRVKAAIRYYQRIGEITDRQVRLVKEYKRAWTLVKTDKHFTVEEVTYIGRIYTGILEQSIQNIDQMMLIVNSFKLQMSDAKRLEMINEAGDRVQQNYDDLMRFNRENALLSLQRAKSDAEVDLVKKLYRLN